MDEQTPSDDFSDARSFRCSMPKRRGVRDVSPIDEAPFLRRVRYLLELLFYGDELTAALVLNITPERLRRLLYRRQTIVPAGLVALFVSRLGVRPEWLLFGVGEIFARDPTVDPSAALTLPFALRSRFPLLAPEFGFEPAGLEFCGPPGWRAAGEFCDEDAAAYISAASAIYSAHAAHKPFGFFLGCDARSQNILPTVRELFRAHNCQFLVTTLSAARRDVAAIHSGEGASLLRVAQLSANAGLGYGEGFGRWLFGFEDADTSLLVDLYARQIPAAVLVEFGEAFEHASVPVRGAEVGAATGAAAHVDFLMAAAWFKKFFAATEGVLCVAGEEERGLRFIYKQYAMFCRTRVPFTVIVFSQPNRRHEALVAGCGGRVIFLPHDYGPAFTRLLEACANVYAGHTT